jgi:hypothetical protein
MYLSSLTAIGIWLLYSDRVMDLYGFLFNMVFISGWNAIEITTIESYPTHLRYELSGLNVSVQASPKPDTTERGSLQITSLSHF